MPIQFIAGYVPWYANALFLDKPEPDRIHYLHLIRSIEDGKPDETKRLLDTGLDPNALIHPEDGHLLEWAAEKSKHPDCLRALIAAGASVKTPKLLCNLVRWGKSSLLPEILAAGADPNLHAPNSWPPICVAAMTGQTDIARHLLEAGANPNAPCTLALAKGKADNVTPLMIAAHYGFLPFVKLLLAHGADPNARDSRSNTAISWAKASASKSKAARVIELLEKHGLDPNVPSAFAPPPDFSARAKSPQFEQAVTLVQERLGTKPKSLQLAEGPLKGSKTFEFKKSQKQKPLDILRELRPQLAPLQTTAFLTEYLMPLGQSRLVLLPTTDIYEIITALETPEGQRQTPADLIAFLKKVQQTQPLDIHTLSPDLLRATFTTEIQNPLDLAQQIEKICPSDAPLESTASQLAQSRELYLWWD